MCWRSSFCNIVPRIAKVLLFWPSTKLKIYRWAWWARKNKSCFNGTKIFHWLCSSFLSFYHDQKMTKAAINSAKAPGKENINLYFGVDEMIGNVTHLRRCFWLCVLLHYWWRSSVERCCIYTLNTCLCVYWAQNNYYKIGCACVLVCMNLYTNVYSLETCPSSHPLSYCPL